MGFNTVSVGSLTASLVQPREVFQPAIIGDAASLILVHNHPSGDRDPSVEDRALARRLRKAGDLLDIRGLGHIVIGAGSYRSLNEAASFNGGYSRPPNPGATPQAAVQLQG